MSARITAGHLDARWVGTDSIVKLDAATVGMVASAQAADPMNPQFQAIMADGQALGAFPARSLAIRAIADELTRRLNAPDVAAPGRQ